MVVDIRLRNFKYEADPSNSLQINYEVMVSNETFEGSLGKGNAIFNFPIAFRKEESRWVIVDNPIWDASDVHKDVSARLAEELVQISNTIEDFLKIGAGISLSPNTNQIPIKFEEEDPL